METFKKERFCNFPHKHGEATKNPEIRDGIKARVSREISSNFRAL